MYLMKLCLVDKGLARMPMMEYCNIFGFNGVVQAPDKIRNLCRSSHFVQLITAFLGT